MRTNNNNTEGGKMSNATAISTMISNVFYMVTELTGFRPHLSACLTHRGFDGRVYLLTGKRNAKYMAYRKANDGAFKIVARAGA
jgi:hypothetical protein